MKKLISIAATLVLLLSFISTPRLSAMSPDKQFITVFGGKLVENRTLLPLRSLFEALDATVSWDSKTNKITVVKQNTTIVLTVNSNTATVNGKMQTIDVPAKVYDGATLVPVRFMTEQLGGSVEWNKERHTVIIETSVAQIEVFVQGTISTSSWVHNFFKTNEIQMYYSFSSDFVMGLTEDQKEVWLGYQSVWSGDDILSGQVQVVDNNTAYLWFKYIYEDDQTTYRGVLKLNGNVLTLIYINLDGEVVTAEFKK
ncbi:copper amine oxidase N-terminal domain-containing protein [Mangrovibacillus cuniculi]|uniref:Copper amine oxidase N-terminal domain-containing protein n=1 Tax=Mangrovibacillus cuniculi TaxID=2593652 RepID=A0A7S8CCX5_9BACI|nr:copper amine oxidase N-terminal domain-containing protein [Mangrovibacillus cuniculi]QPC47546.1 copper amine oxidase N-terminal domain-containing protein [Mangrovibacillus cuniculi]